MTDEIRKYMQDNIQDHVDPLTGEANVTALAEDAINALAGDEWHEWHEETHEVWDIAVDVSEACGYGLKL